MAEKMNSEMQDTLFPAETAAAQAPTAPNPTPMVSVPQDALYQVLRALMGPGHLIRELQATMNLPPLAGHANPINVLVQAYNNRSE